MIPVRLDNSRDQTLQVQLYEQIQQAILRRELSPGASLPATRVLADDLSISRNTVIYAYDRLLSEGFLESRGRQGTYVATNLPQELLEPTSDEGMRVGPKKQKVPLAPSRLGWEPFATHTNDHANARIDMNPDIPWRHVFPAKQWKRLSGDLLTSGGSSMIDPVDPAGLWALRSEIAKYIGPARGVSAAPEQIFITSGKIEALNLISSVLVCDGTVVVTEDPCGRWPHDVFRSYGAQSVPVQVGGDGIDVSLIREHGPKLIYLTPSYQFPLGITMNFENRLRLLDYVSTTRAYIIEDDHHGDFRYDGPPVRALYASATEQSVIFIGDFAYSLGAGFQMGFLVVPEDLVAPITAAKRMQGTGQSWLQQQTLSNLIAGGHYSRHLRRLKSANRSRRDSLIDAMKTAFGSVEFTGGNGGISLAWQLPKAVKSAAGFRAAALRDGVAVYSFADRGAIEMTAQRYEPQTICLGYASVSDKQIWEAMSVLSRVLR